MARSDRISLSRLRLVGFDISLATSALRPPRSRSSMQQILVREQNHRVERRIRFAGPFQYDECSLDCEYHPLTVVFDKEARIGHRQYPV